MEGVLQYIYIVSDSLTIITVYFLGYLFLTF
jgi:hypothetical protein